MPSVETELSDQAVTLLFEPGSAVPTSHWKRRGLIGDSHDLKKQELVYSLYLSSRFESNPDVGRYFAEIVAG